MFDPYPRHGHRTPDQIAEDTGGSFEPTHLRRRARDLFDEPRTTSAVAAPRTADGVTRRSEDGPQAR